MKQMLLTYFTNKTLDEFDSAIIDLQTSLSKNFKTKEKLMKKITSLFVEHFDANNLLLKYKISISSKLEKAIQETLKYAIDTEMMIRRIYNILEEC